jgi:OB-fold nucleic acid binding domain
VLEALRYGKGLRADELLAVHFMVDAEHAAALRKRWDDFDLDTALRVVDCPDRQIIRAVYALIIKARDERRNTNVTVLLPRRTYAPVLGRLLHDRTADKISKAVSRIPDAAATIVPYDVQGRIREAFPDTFEMRVARQFEKVETWIWRSENQTVEDYQHPEPEHPERSAAVIPVDHLIPGRTATVEGRVSEVEDITKRQKTSRTITVGDDSGEIRVTFRPGQGVEIQPGQVLRVTGKARQTANRQISMSDPTYRVIETPEQS